MLKLEQKCIIIFTTCICILFAQPLPAQYISLQGVNTTNILSDNTKVDFDISSAVGAEVNYSNSFLFGFNYNLGAEYLYAHAANLFSLKTGISKMYLVPTSFHKAKNKESVSYITNNWLGSLDLNFYNGFTLSPLETNYVLAAEPAWNIAYLLGKKKRFFIGGELAVRYTVYPGDVKSSSLSVPVQFGIRYEI